MEKGSVYKEYYPVDEEVRKLMLAPESNEERQAYFDFLADCIEKKVCSDCGDDVVFDETWTKDEIGEYPHSALCRHCQKEQFGI